MTEFPMPDFDLLRPDGLMKCCTETIADLYPNGPAKIAEEGQILRCKYYPENPQHVMIFTEGAWQWKLPKETQEKVEAIMEELRKLGTD